MSNADRDPILLTPGPLTTSLATKAAMLRDWGSWDARFNAVTARVRARLTAVVNGEGTHVCVPMQGSGTFSVEAAVNTLVPRSDGHRAGADQRRLRQATRPADRDDGTQAVDIRDGRRRADHAPPTSPGCSTPIRRSPTSA